MNGHFPSTVNKLSKREFKLAGYDRVFDDDICR